MRDAFQIFLLQSGTFRENGRAAIIFSYSLMQTVNGSLSINEQFMSFITPHFLIALYRTIWMTVMALFHFALAVHYKWDPWKGWALKWLYRLSLGFFFLFFFLGFIAIAYVLIRLRVPPWVSMKTVEPRYLCKKWQSYYNDHIVNVFTFRWHDTMVLQIVKEIEVAANDQGLCRNFCVYIPLKLQ